MLNVSSELCDRVLSGLAANGVTMSFRRCRAKEDKQRTAAEAARCLSSLLDSLGVSVSVTGLRHRASRLATTPR